MPSKPLQPQPAKSNNQKSTHPASLLMRRPLSGYQALGRAGLQSNHKTKGEIKHAQNFKTFDLL
jgi:hypothetical protein